MTISFIVATIGRPTLAAALGSIELRRGDELIVVGDHLDVSGLPHADVVRYLPHPAGNDWGHTERNFAMTQARGQYIAHLDDDDVYAPGHRAMMAEEIERNPGRPVILKMRCWFAGVLWRDKVIRHSNIGTPMMLFPNDRLGQFGSWHGGDIHYAETFAANHGYASGDFVWSEALVALIRPHRT